jgi:hypothetical protein
MAVALIGAAFFVLTACKTTPQTPEQQAVTMSNIVRVAEITKVTVRAGVIADIIANPQHAELIRKSVEALNTGIESGSLTGGQVAGIVAALPIDKKIVQTVSGAMLVYDSLTLLFYSPVTQAGTLVIAKAIADGAMEGLNAVAYHSKDAAASVRVKKAPTVVPAPTSANTRGF